MQRSLVSDATVKGLDKFPVLTQLQLAETKAGDGVAAQIGALKTLESLYISDTALGDEGMKAIAAMPEMKYLQVNKTAVSDAGLAGLDMPKLYSVDLSGTKATAATLEKLAVLDTMRSISMRETELTQEQVDAALKARGEGKDKLTIYK